MIDDVKFLEYVVKALVSHPDDIKIKRTVDEMGVLMTLDVHPEDMGKVIGRSGNTAKAIRILLRVVGIKNNSKQDSNCLRSITRATNNFTHIFRMNIEGHKHPHLINSPFYFDIVWMTH